MKVVKKVAPFFHFTIYYVEDKSLEKTINQVFIVGMICRFVDKADRNVVHYSLKASLHLVDICHLSQSTIKPSFPPTERVPCVLGLFHGLNGSRIQGSLYRLIKRP